MPESIQHLTKERRAVLFDVLMRIQEELDHAGEMVTAARIAHALDCLASRPSTSGELPPTLHESGV